MADPGYTTLIQCGACRANWPARGEQAHRPGCSLSVPCPHCSQPPGRRCTDPSGGSARVHATRRMWALDPTGPPPRPNPAPATAVAAKRHGSNGTAWLVVKATKRLPDGGMWVAVDVYAGAGAGRRVGVELAAEHVHGALWDDRALRAAVEAEGSRAPTGWCYSATHR